MHGVVLLLDVVTGGGGNCGGLCTLATLLGGLVGGGHTGVEGGEVAHHALVLVLLVGVDGLGMLAEVVEARELLSTMAGERTLAGVFSKIGLVRDRWRTGRHERYLMCLARCSLLLKTMRQSP